MQALTSTTVSTSGTSLSGLKYIPLPPRLQALMKIIVYGLAFNGRGSYLRGPWNILDLFVVIVGVLVLVLESFLNANDIIWLRAIRAMRQV